MHRSISIAQPDEAQDELTQLGRAFDLIHGLVDFHVLQRMAYALQGGEFTFSQLHALHRIYRNGPQTIAELAKGLALSQTAGSRMVERLVRVGLVERTELPTDRRSKVVELTEAGVERLRDLQEFTVKTYVDLLERVPPETLGRLAAVLAEVRPHLPTHPLLKSE